jgi:hypothetical protein
VLPRAAKSALFSVFVLGFDAAPTRVLPAWLARDAEGARTADYVAVRSFFGMTPNEHEPASP